MGDHDDAITSAENAAVSGAVAVREAKMLAVHLRY